MIVNNTKMCSNVDKGIHEYELGELFTRHNKLSVALNHYKNSHNFGNNVAVYKICDVCIKMGNYSTAIQYYKELYSKGEFSYCEQIGYCYEKINRYMDAIAFYGKMKNTVNSHRLIGKLYMTMRQYKNAYRSFLLVLYKNIVIIFDIIDVCIKLNKYLEIIEHINNILDVVNSEDSVDIDVELLYYNLIKACIYTKQFYLADKYVDNITNKDNKHYLLGLIHEKQDLRNDAICNYTKINDKCIKNMALAEFYNNIKDTGNAILYFSTADKLNNHKCYYKAGMYFYRNNNIEFAKYYFNRGMSNNCGKSANRLGCIYNANKSVKYALHCFSQAIKFNYMPSYYNAGNVYRKLGNYKNAIYHYKLSLQYNMTNAYFDIANISVLMDDFECAVEYYNYSIQYRKHMKECIQMLLYIYEHKYSNTTYIDYLYTGYRDILSDLDKANLLMQIGRVYEKKCDYSTALYYYITYYHTFGDNDNICIKIGYMYYKSKQYHESARYYLRSINKKETFVTNMLSLINMRLGHYTLAEQFLAKIENNNFSPALNNLGVLKYKQGKLDDAISYFEKAFLLNDNKYALHNLGRMYEIQKKYTIAHEYYEMAISKGNVKTMLKYSTLYYAFGNFNGYVKYYNDANKLINAT
jgi:tetratricopeptide (TPR) repeat protein